LDGTVEADDLYHTAGHKGQAKTGGKKSLGRQPRRRRKKREPGRGHYDKDRPAIIAWVSRQGGVVIQTTRDFTVKTVQKAADLAVRAGSQLYTDSASSYRALKGYVHDFVNHTKKEYARGEVHENRAECLFSLLKPYLRVFRGISKTNLPGYVRFFQFLRSFYQLTVFEQAEMILYAALDPAIASRAKKGDFVTCLEHFALLQSSINWAIPAHIAVRASVLMDYRITSGMLCIHSIAPYAAECAVAFPTPSPFLLIPKVLADIVLKFILRREP
jgi:transposase-like protein